MTHICSNLTSIAADNGLILNRRQAIIWTNAGILLIGPCATNFIEILIEIPAFKNFVCEMAVILSRPRCFNCFCMDRSLSFVWKNLLCHLMVAKWEKLQSIFVSTKQFSTEDIFNQTYYMSIYQIAAMFTGRCKCNCVSVNVVDNWNANDSR